MGFGGFDLGLMSPLNRSVIVHLTLILTSVGDWVSRKTSSLNGGGYGGSLLRAHFAPEWVPFTIGIISGDCATDDPCPSRRRVLTRLAADVVEAQGDACRL